MQENETTGAAAGKRAQIFAAMRVAAAADMATNTPHTVPGNHVLTFGGTGHVYPCPEGRVNVSHEVL